MSRILETYAKQSGVINRAITSKYKEVIEDVRYYVADGWDHEEAVILAMQEWAWKFESAEDKELLKTWFDGSFGKFAA